MKSISETKEQGLYKKELSKQILTIPPEVMKKYNKEKGLQITFTLAGLEQLRNKYRRIRGLPGFVHNTMSHRPTPHRNLILFNSHLYYWTQDCSFVIFPNSCVPYESFLGCPRAIKNSCYGLSLVAWWMAPEILKNYGWKKQAGEEKNDLFRSFLLNTPVKNISSRYRYFERSDSQEEIGKLEHKHKDHYLATILDLRPEHLDLLKNLKRECFLHLEKNYGVTKKDLVKTYFHFPYDELTTTLHLHIKINSGRHPMEEARSFSLDEIIECLEKSKSIHQLILERGIYFTDDLDILHNIEGITIKEAKNPYIISHRYIYGSIGSLFNFKSKFATLSARSSKSDLDIINNESRINPIDCWEKDYFKYSETPTVTI